MSIGNLRSIVSLIIILGHIIIFIIGFFLLSTLGPLEIKDSFQLVLMSSPILSITAIQSMKYIIENEKYVFRKNNHKPVSKTFALLLIILPILLLASIMTIFSFVYYQINGFSFSDITLSLGIIETFFGVYLGMISDKLFRA